MYIGMRGHDFDTNTLDALCEKCKEYGVGGVQLVLLRSLADFKKGNFTPEYAKSIGDKLRENGIRVPILGCYINPSDANEESLNESLDYFIENLHYAKYIGAEMVGLETCRFSDDDEINNSEETYQYLFVFRGRGMLVIREFRDVIFSRIINTPPSVASTPSHGAESFGFTALNCSSSRFMWGLPRSSSLNTNPPVRTSGSSVPSMRENLSPFFRSSGVTQRAFPSRRPRSANFGMNTCS